MNALQLSKCLADETRLRLMLLLQRNEELCVCDLTETLRQSQPKVSRHLAQLRECGLIQGRRQGKWMFYRLHPQLPLWAGEVLKALQHGDARRLEADQQRLSLVQRKAETCC